MLTPYGYDVTANSIPPIIDLDDLDDLFPEHGLTDDQAAAVCAAVSEVIRNYCGWHVTPPMDCTIEATACGNLVQLPTTCLVSVTSVTSDGASVTDFEHRRNGLIRSTNLSQKWGGVSVSYRAGVDSMALKHMAANMVRGEVRRNPGISAENAGGVSVSYDSTSLAITEREAIVFKPYRLAVAP